jgi:hypothetical protein
MSWDELLGVFKADTQEQLDNARRPPVACPNDGEPLQPGPGGVLHCPSGDYEYPRDWS